MTERINNDFELILGLHLQRISNEENQEVYKLIGSKICEVFKIHYENAQLTESDSNDMINFQIVLNKENVNLVLEKYHPLHNIES
ncbi:MAG: hypothetical protein Kow0076_7640 [Francisella sp.]